MKLKYLIVVIISLTANFLFAQPVKKINGIVRSSNNKSLLSYASVGIEGTGIGTVTNEAGVFTLYIPFENLTENLKISYVGFKSFEKKIKDLVGDTIHFNLEPDSLVLTGVIILQNGMTPGGILKEAISRISKNYDRQSFYLQAFYRQMATKDETYTRLLEAAIEIQDFGYDANSDRRKVKVIELRKSDDFIERGWRDFLVKAIYGTTNGMITTITDCDWVSKMYDKRNGFDPKKNKISLNRILKFDGEDVYEIEYENTDFYLPNNTIYYINTTDYAIIKVDCKCQFPTNNSNSDKSAKALFYAAKWETQSIYRKVGDKYYLSYGKRTEPASFAAVEKDKIGVGDQFIRHEILINNVLTQRSSWERVKRKEKQIKDTDIYNQSFEYNPGFWANYVIIVRNPILKQVRNDLNRGKDIEEQFFDNSK